MSISFATAILDAPLDAIAQATELYVCSSLPTDRNSAAAANLIDAVIIDASDFSKSTQGTSRRLTVAGQSSDGSANGTATHVALCTATTLLYARAITPQSINVGSPVTIGQFTIETTPEAI